MTDLLKQNVDTLPEHMTPDGDIPVWGYKVEALAPDNSVIVTLTVKIYSSAALSVDGHIGDEAVAISILDHAEDAIRGYHTQTKKIVIPGRDVDLPIDQEVASVRVSGFSAVTDAPIQDKMYAVACMCQAKAAVKDLHQRRKKHVENKTIVGGVNRLEM